MVVHETTSARWVRQQLEMRGMPLYPPVTLIRPTKDSPHRYQGFAWVAVDRRGLEVAGSELPIAQLRALPHLLGIWPGHGMMRLGPSSKKR